MSKHHLGARVQARAFVLKTYLSSGVAAGALAAALTWPGSAQAACTTAGTTITCSGTTTGSPNGFGDGTQNNFTVNVQNNATVSGTQAGFDVGSGNTFTIGTGATVQQTNSPPNVLAAILTAGSVTVTNSGSILGTGGLGIDAENGNVTVMDNTGTISSNGPAVQAQSGNITLTNSNIITSAGVAAIDASLGSGTITNNRGATITGTAASDFTIFTNSLNLTNNGMVQQTGGNGNIAIFTASGPTTITNSGTIQATGTSNVNQAFAVNAGGTTMITNNAGGVIQANALQGFGVFSVGPTTLMNGGKISGGQDGFNTNTSGTTTVTNSGTISGMNRSGIRVNSASITNSSGGAITGTVGIFSRSGVLSIVDAGTITGTQGATPVAIQYATAGNTLELGAGFAITGTVAGGSNNIFKLGGSGTGTGAFDLSTIGPQYQNFTTFSVEGGLWNTSNAFSQTQTWNVNGGALGGTGTLKSVNVNNGGALAPGVNGSSIGGIGTLTVNGNLALQSGSLYVVGVNAAASGKTAVTGTATINGSSNAEAVFQGTNFQQQYTILSATGGRTGTFGTFTPVNLPSFITAALVYTPTDVDLTLTSHFTQIGGLTGNQSAVGAGLDSAINSGAGFLAGLSGLTAAQIPGALDALSGQGTTGTQETALGSHGMFLNAVTEQGLSWLNSETGYSVGSGGGGALNYADDHRKRRQHPALKAIPVKAPVEEPPRWRTWAAGFDGSWKLAGEAGIGSADLSHRTAGGAGGFDYTVNPDLLVGFAAGGSTSTFSVPTLATSGSVDGAHLGAYGVARWGAWYGTGALTAAAFDNRTSRTIVGVGPTEVANASFKSNLFGGRFELGHKQAFEGFAITPFAAVQFAKLWQQGYTENSVTASGTPGVLGLTFQSHQVSSLPTFLGAQFDTRVVLPSGMLWTPYARVSWVHEFDPTRHITASFLTLANSTFTVDGPRAARDAARIDVGSKLAITRTVSLFGTFDGEFSDRSQLYSGNGGLRVVW